MEHPIKMDEQWGYPLFFWKHPILWMFFFLNVCEKKQKSPQSFKTIETPLFFYWNFNSWAKSKVGPLLENSAAGEPSVQLVELV